MEQVPLIVSFFYKTNNEFKVRDELKGLFNTVFGTFLNTRWNVYVNFKGLPHLLLSESYQFSNFVYRYGCYGGSFEFFGQFSVSQFTKTQDELYPLWS